MKPQTFKALTALTSVALCSGFAQADYVFSFSGTILSGTDASGASLAGQQYTLEMFVLESAGDLTPSGSTGNYALHQLTMNIGSDASVEDTFSTPSSFSSVFVDDGPTQLVGASDLFSPDVSFMLGVNLPSTTFGDVHDLSGQGNFSLAGLTTSSYSYYDSMAFGSLLELDNTAFSFASVAVVPMPTSLAMGLMGLLGVGVLARRR